MSSPTFFRDIFEKWLDTALSYGITEAEFWEMTIGELERAIRSKQKAVKAKAQEQATYDYILAELIGRSVARIYNSSNKMPEIAEVYPNLFDAAEIEERKQAKKAELSALRFKQFANSYNQRFKEVAKKSE